MDTTAGRTSHNHAISCHAARPPAPRLQHANMDPVIPIVPTDSCGTSRGALSSKRKIIQDRNTRKTTKKQVRNARYTPVQDRVYSPKTKKRNAKHPGTAPGYTTAQTRRSGLNVWGAPDPPIVALSRDVICT